MGRNWQPKTLVECKCGWRGHRVALTKACPACGYYYPKAAFVREFGYSIVTTDTSAPMMIVRSPEQMPWRKSVLPAIKNFTKVVNGGENVRWQDIFVHGMDGDAPDRGLSEEQWQKLQRSDHIKSKFVLIDLRFNGTFDVISQPDGSNFNFNQGD